MSKPQKDYGDLIEAIEISMKKLGMSANQQIATLVAVLEDANEDEGDDEDGDDEDAE